MRLRSANILRIVVFTAVSIFLCVMTLTTFCLAQTPQSGPVASASAASNLNTPSMFWADTILLFAGLLVIAIALILNRRFGNRPVQFGFTKLGLDLKADRLTFILVVGLVLIGVGVFFRYRNYELALETLKLQVQDANALQTQQKKDLESLKDELGQFKVYDLGLDIVFPNVPGDQVEQFFEIQVWLQKSKDRPFELTDFKPFTDFGRTYVKLRNLNRGEVVKIVAKDKRDNTEWHSVNDILIPESQIQMKKTGSP